MKNPPQVTDPSGARPPGGKSRRVAVRVTVQQAKVGTEKKGWLGFKISNAVTYPLVNLSRSGLQYLSPVAFEASLVVDVTLRCPAFKELLVIRSRVMWSRRLQEGRKGFRIGLKFIKMKDVTQQRIKALVSDPLMRSVGKGALSIGM